MMLDISDPVVSLKLDILKAAMPATSAVVFGDMYIVEGGYTAKCIDYGCERVLLVDSLETPAWLETRARYPKLDFYKGDFSDPLFMNSIREQFSVSVAFDILLHQAPLVSTLHLILEKTRDTIVIAQPVLKERQIANSLVYLPGQSTDSTLYPMAKRSDDFRAFDVMQVNQSHWIWGMTPSLIRSLLTSEEFNIIHQVDGPDLENPEWMWWGCIARKMGVNPNHWSRTMATPGLYTPTS